jgi:hypothetical protein
MEGKHNMNDFEKSIALIELLKKNAPNLFALYIVKRCGHLEKELEELRKSYKNSESEEQKKAIKEHGLSLRVELDYLRKMES